jgi:hypothetical protein
MNTSGELPMVEKIVSAPEQKPPEASVANAKNPSIADMIANGTRRRIPLSTAVQKMTVPAIDGYYLYWFKESNIPSALDAGYEFVNRDEHHLAQVGLAADKSTSGNTDLGTRVSIMGNLYSSPTGGPERTYLMKIRQAWRDEDRAEIDSKNATIMSAIFGKEALVYGAEGTVRERSGTEYVRTALFQRPVRKAKIGNR